MTNRIPAGEVLDKIRKKSFSLPSEFIVTCSRIKSVAYRDLVELYLLQAGALKFSWADNTGATTAQQNVFRSLWNLLKDFVAWPWLYSRALIRAMKLASQQSIPVDPLRAGPIVYLRTDHTFDQKYGGAVAHTSGVISGFRALNHQVKIIASDLLTGVSQDDDFQLLTPMYGLGRNVPNMAEICYTEQVMEAATLCISSFSPVFIYQRYTQGNLAGALLSRRHGVPFVLEYNGSTLWVSRQWGGRAAFHENLLTQIETANLKAANLLVVVSRALKDEVVSRGVPEHRVLVNPNAVDPEVYSPVVSGKPMRDRLGLQGKTVIGFIGSFGAWHGAEVLAEAFARLIELRPELRDQIRLLMVGDGNTMPQVKKLIADHGLDGLCILPGMVPQDEGPAYLAACDVLVSPHIPNADGSAFFGSPTKLFEYMAMGKAIVASNLDQIGEVLEHGESAWLVEPGNAEALAEGLAHVIDDQDLQKAMATTARKHAVEHHTWNHHTKSIIAALSRQVDSGISD